MLMSSLLIIVNRMQNRVTSCLFSLVAEFANGFKIGGVGIKKNSSTKNTKSSLLVPSPFRHSSEGRQIRPAELGKQPEF